MHGALLHRRLGTEAGIDEPVTAFSACFGAPFLPLHPTKYAEMLGAKMEEHDAVQDALAFEKEKTDG